MIEEAVLPVDFAHDVSSDTFVLASAGGGAVFSVAVPLADVTTEVAFPACDLGPPIISAPMPTAVEVRPGTGVLVFARTDQQLRSRDATIVRLSPYPLPEGTAFDGFFRRVGRAPMACATCHPEGAEDGHVWRFGGVGPRRTQTTAGNIVGTAPFHWSGDVPDMDVIIDTNMERMGRSPLDPRAPTLAFEALLETFAAPAPPRSADDASALAGRAVFDAAGCADCHSGDAGTNHLTLDVGTGEPFQVPHLIGVAHRAQFFHDGCAETLRAVLDGCETHAPDAHTPSALTEADKDALVAYLESR